MFSLYIHIPFCEKKCSYCNFFITPIEGLDKRTEFIQNYVDSILKEIEHWANIFPENEIKTIYFWWWTPSSIWKDNVIKIIDKISEKFNLEFLEELSIELNPDPFDETLDFIKSLNEKYPNLFRLRYSFGIQSLDDETLRLANRNYYFNTLVWFLRSLWNVKSHNNVFNFDFIAFWHKEKFWDQHRLNFFQDFITSWLVDSLSLYTLELFPGSIWYNNMIENWKLKIENSEKDDLIYQEFDYLKDMVLDAWFRRYEISNFATLGKESLHNKVYWEMWNYIWLWINSSSFLKWKYLEKIIKNLENNWRLNIEDWKLNWVRFTNTTSWDKYNNWEYIDKEKTILLTDKDYKIEQFFLWLRTINWVENIDDYSGVLVSNYKEKIKEYIENWYIMIKDTKTILTDDWMSVYNYLITELIR